MEKRSRDVSQCEVWILLKSSRLAISRTQFTFELSSDSEIVLSFCRIVNLYCYICNWIAVGFMFAGIVLIRCTFVQNDFYIWSSECYDMLRSLFVPDMIPESYAEDISQRGLFRYWLGWLIRLLQSIKYWRARRIARRNGAKIGEWAVFSVALARKMNANVVVGGAFFYTNW